MTALGRAGLAWVVGAVLGIAWLPRTTSAQTYDAASEFSPLDNPTGVWSYGWEAGQGAAFNLYGNHNEDLRGVDWWTVGSAVGTVPAVWHNPTSVPISEGTWTLPKGQLAFHPGQTGQNSVVRWTAPAAGTVTVSGSFTGYDFYFPTTSDVAVLHDSATTLFSGEIDSFDQPLTFSETVAVAFGDTIDFNVGYGADGNDVGDTTGIDATIKYTTDVGPIVNGISPASAEAGGPAFTMQVKGSNFNSASVVNWLVGKTATPLSTTWVSSTLIKAAVPASLIAAVGKAAVNVTIPNLGTSDSKAFIILAATIKLAKVQVTVGATGNYVAALTFNNVGYQAVSDINVNQATLNGAPTYTTLPLPVGNIAGGATGATTLTFPASAGTKKTKVKLLVAGTYTGGKFSYSVGIILP